MKDVSERARRGKLAHAKSRKALDRSRRLIKGSLTRIDRAKDLSPPKRRPPGK